MTTQKRTDSPPQEAAHDRPNLSGALLVEKSPGLETEMAKRLIAELRDFLTRPPPTFSIILNYLRADIDETEYVRRMFLVDEGRLIIDKLQLFIDRAAEIGKPAIPFLKEIVENDHDPLMREAAFAAAYALVHYGHREATAILIHSSSDPITYIREHAARALQKVTIEAGGR